ncbi:DUF2306 domain-containing protein [Brevibacterium casei]|uniref:Uncharacterized membrane protein n=1 Tax=Brevibacterium casei CIP 102111 TaxID=1255625 RepID=A0A2H1JF54_9MICO|nr:DUF2306 domain-containing protein [Brevibacterium casei]QPR39072.1 DUF2306 domain-containing protein [Brevibacterium casei]QPR43238.1 DUF2306 domain-containing protein [Brevibacterium casei]SMX86120.1 Uncharacterized membrane protein [Brevibacterium casei CIP 102111]
MDTLTPVIAIHAIAALYVLLLGPVQIFRRRRDTAHRILGAGWVTAIVTVCVSSFWIMPNGFTWLHGLSIWTLVCVAAAITAIRLGSVRVHRHFMIGAYIGTLIAFVFASIIPARLIPQMLRSEPLVVIVTVLAVAATVTVFVRVVTVRAKAPEPVPEDAVT